MFNHLIFNKFFLYLHIYFNMVFDKKLIRGIKIINYLLFYINFILLKSVFIYYIHIYFFISNTFTFVLELIFIFFKKYLF